MIAVEVIDEARASIIYSENKDFPLFAKAPAEDVVTLLTDALFTSTGTSREHNSHEYAKIIARHLPFDDADSHLKKAKIPILLLRGSYIYRFPSNTPGAIIEGVLSAPLLTFFVPDAGNTDEITPIMFSSPDTHSVVFNYQKFLGFLAKSPPALEFTLEERDRLMMTTAKWLSTASFGKISYRIARYLLTQIPDTYDKESINLAVTHHQLTEALVVSRATLAKGLQYLRTKNVISQSRGEISVNIHKLREYVLATKVY